MPNASIRRALRTLARADDAILADYGATRGSLTLRGLLARQFASDGLEVGADEILLTSSGTQAIDLVCRVFLQPGDTVLRHDPCHFNFQAVLRAHRVAQWGVIAKAAVPVAGEGRMVGNITLRPLPPRSLN